MVQQNNALFVTMMTFMVLWVVRFWPIMHSGQGWVWRNGQGWVLQHTVYREQRREQRAIRDVPCGMILYRPVVSGGAVALMAHAWEPQSVFCHSSKGHEG